MITNREYFYRLGNEEPATGFIWSGRIATNKPVTEKQARALIRKTEGLKRLPARTLVMSVSDLIAHKQARRSANR
tara:strand:+ start:509 stop:733 length:225 start_codon:yes stop_codon:yes gene_type:complete